MSSDNPSSPGMAPRWLLHLPHGVELFVLMLAGLLFLPKIDLVAVPGQTAGLRLDDMLLLLAVLLLALCWLCNQRNYYMRIEVFLAFFVGIAIFSAFLNGEARGIAYAVRILQYFVFFYVGMIASLYFSLGAFCFLFIFFNAFLIFMQMLGILPAFHLGELIYHMPIGIGSGTWEIGLLLNFAMAVIMFQGRLRMYTLFPLYILVLFLFLVIGSRVPALVHLGLLLVYLFLQTPLRNRIIGLGLVGLAGLLLILTPAVRDQLEGSTLFKRAETIFSADNILAVAAIWRNVNPSKEVNYNYSEKYHARMADSDLSLLLRVEKTFIALKYYMNATALQWLVGVGPGQWGTALDMGHIRLLTENGLLGTALFWLLMYAASRRRLYTRVMFGIFMVNSLTLDAYLAYKIMSFYFFACGYALMSFFRDHPDHVPPLALWRPGTFVLARQDLLT